MSSGYKQFFKAALDVKQGIKTSPAPSFKVKPRPSSSAAKSVLEQDLRLRQALGRRARKKPPFPWRALSALAVCTGAFGFYVAAPDVVEGWYNKIEISALGQAAAKEEKPAATAAPPGSAEKSKGKSPESEKTAAKGATETKGKNPDDPHTGTEEANHFEKLKQRKEELDLREKELSQLEEELQRQKVELDKRITQLEEMRGQIAQVLKDRVEMDQEKVTKLVDLYSNMKPKQAADVIASINEDLAVEVLAKMKKKSAAEIMNLLPADKARVLSEKYTGYRRSHAVDPKG